MLANKEAAANIAVRNIDAAQKFHEGTLGLKVLDTEGDEVVAYGSAGGRILVYRSDYAGTNKARATCTRATA